MIQNYWSTLFFNLKNLELKNLDFFYTSPLFLLVVHVKKTLRMQFFGIASKSVNQQIIFNWSLDG